VRGRYSGAGSPRFVAAAVAARGRLARRAARVLAALALATLALAARADAFIYRTTDNGTIARAKLVDGSGVPSFITGAGQPLRGGGRRQLLRVTRSRRFDRSLVTATTDGGTNM
jgi:hypothetical protein